jgi:phytanoyl-CoA hydroxylase
MSLLDFDPRTLPWTDRDDFPAALERRREAGTVSGDEATLLEQWSRDGYVRFPGLIEDNEIDRLVDDAERAWTERPRIDINVSDLGILELPAAPSREEIGHHHFRLLDLQDTYETPRRILLGPRLIRFLSLIFDDTPVAMQSLYFEYPSEQETHQDFPFVQSQILSHLVGCWIACEDVGKSNGPLVYYPGSHRLPKYDWGGGSLKLEGPDDGRVQVFSEHLERACAAAGFEARTLPARAWRCAGRRPGGNTAHFRRSLLHPRRVSERSAHTENAPRCYRAQRRKVLSPSAPGSTRQVA